MNALRGPEQLAFETMRDHDVVTHFHGIHAALLAFLPRRIVSAALV
jgi:hypothetical protein